jgi:hypothetical protein
VLSGIGGGLAVIALTLPWVQVMLPGQTLRALPVTDIPGHGPIFAVLLVVTALLVAVGFAVGRQSVGMLRLSAVMLGAIPALCALFVGVRPSQASLRQAFPTDDPQPADLPVAATSGLTLYVTGLLLTGLGLAVASIGSSGRITLTSSPEPVMSARRKTVLRWSALGLALPLAALSLALNWFEVTSADGRTPAVVEGWQTVYRIGLVAVLLLLVATQIAVGGPRRLVRTVGMFLCFGLIATLSINALLLWDPTDLVQQVSSELDSLSLGPAYLAALGAAPLLVLVLWASDQSNVEEP